MILVIYVHEYFKLDTYTKGMLMDKLKKIGIKSLIIFYSLSNLKF